MKRMYPDDGGLKEQVRPFDETFSAWTLILDAFLGKDRDKVDSALTSEES
jgi:hypothetical protein